MSAEIVSQFTKLSRHGSTQTYYRVKCECGYQSTFWALSWGGHGKQKCKGCGAFIYKRTLEVRANNACR